MPKTARKPTQGTSPQYLIATRSPFWRIGLCVAVLAGGATAPAGATQRAAVPLRLVTADSGNEVRYRVREQLVGFDFPNDAIGRTTDLRGQLILDGTGNVVPGESRFVVNLGSLASDRDMRDNYLRRRTLEVDRFPVAELVVTELRGIPWPLPATGSFSFTLVGDFTFKGVTRPTTWNVSAEASNGAFRGLSKTSFTFATFEMTKPRVARVLTVDDTITLEYDFHLVPPP